MKRKWLMLLLLFTAFLSGCTESEDEAEDDSSAEDEIYVTGTGDPLFLAQNEDDCHGYASVQAGQGVVQAMDLSRAPTCQ